jgi:UDP-glucose 4-epimerase
MQNPGNNEPSNLPLLAGKTILITGGAGFIGSAFVSRVISHNRVIIYDNMSRASLVGQTFAGHPNLTLVQGDVLDYALLAESIREANIVVHCAAIAGIDTVIKKPTKTMRVNLLGTANVLEAARHAPGLEQLVNFSTSEVFGQSAFRVEEGDATRVGPVGEARWTYAVGKLAGEHLARAYYDEFALPVTTLRPFNIYGPGQVGEGALMIFVQRAIEGQDIIIHGDGNQIRAWCYIDDFIDGLLLTLTHRDSVGESLNIGNARAVVTIYVLAKTIVRVLNSTSRIRFVEKGYPDVELRVPSIAKAKDILGFEAKVDLEEGIALTAEYYRRVAR